MHAMLEAEVLLVNQCGTGFFLENVFYLDAKYKC